MVWSVHLSVPWSVFYAVQNRDPGSGAGQGKTISGFLQGPFFERAKGHILSVEGRGIPPWSFERGKAPLEKC